ncbi:hypothetical protein [Streptomyces carpaticus]|uniref:Uncharacterized protein n=1 Tax=Streptomyces carpaticus TaxID=285558 RepID=A0ABV4ZJ64_9ACTN
MTATATAPLTVIGIDAGPGTTTLRTADHVLHRLADVLPLPAGAFACTHRVRPPGERPGLALSLAVPATVSEAILDGLGAVAGPAGLRFGTEAGAGAALAAAEHTGRDGGRAVYFPGGAELPGRLTVGELLATTAIDAAEVLGGTPADPDTVLITRSHVRPEWVAGRLLLRLMPALGGTYVPFETPDPHPCCGADHD